MARDGGGGAALGWTLLGFLVGIAATLGLQTLMGAEQPGHAAASSSAIHLTPSNPTETAKPARKTAPTASGAPALVAAQSEADVADDAAAAGMTSRVAPASEQPGDRAPAVSN